MELIGIGKESDINSLGNWTDDNDAPVCSDESPFPTWSNWAASQRDLYILDLNGDLVLQQNVTSGLPDDLIGLIQGLLSPTTAPCIIGDVYVSEAHTSGNPEDYIEIYNSGSSDCSLAGFQLDDNPELDDFTFGDVIITAGGYWIGYEDYEGSFSSGLSSEGDIVVFADSSGNSLTVTLEPSEQLDGVQLSQSFDEDGVGCYTNPTPGTQNSECVSLSTNESELYPFKFSLKQNYPNPFNPRTRVGYFLSQDSHVSLSIYDMLGNKVTDVINEKQTSGYRSIFWDATDDKGRSIPAGVYLYKMKVGDNSQIKKMLFIK